MQYKKAEREKKAPLQCSEYNFKNFEKRIFPSFPYLNYDNVLIGELAQEFA